MRLLEHESLDGALLKVIINSSLIMDLFPNTVNRELIANHDTLP